MIKVNEKQKRCPETGKTKDIRSDMSNQKNRNFDFVKMKSFLKTELLTINLSKVNF